MAFLNVISRHVPEAPPIDWTPNNWGYLLLYYTQAICKVNTDETPSTRTKWELFRWLWFISFLCNLVSALKIMSDLLFFGVFRGYSSLTWLTFYVLIGTMQTFLMPPKNQKPQLAFKPFNPVLVFFFLLYAVPLCMNFYFVQNQLSAYTVGEPEGYSTVSCKIDNANEVECLVDVQNLAPNSASDHGSSGEWDFCGALCHPLVDQAPCKDSMH